MSEVDIWYEGNLSTRCVHRKNNVEILTDAPKENHGLGRFYSPTDLVIAALGSCVLTLMGIIASKKGVDITGTKMTILKEMQVHPLRRIGRITAHIYCPYDFPDEVKEALIKAAQTCPVKQSLHPDIQEEMVFHWGQS